jgi:ABC-type Fe3+/spermidine/putrescine transport system ATPase subunit
MGKLNLRNIKVERESFEVVVPELTVEAGSILGIMGKSGSGKSTLLNAIAGFEKVSTGEISFDERILSELPPEKRKVAIVFQRPALFSHLTVLENVCFGLRIQRIPFNKQVEIARHWLSKLEVEHLASRRPEELSGGEAQRVALARSLVVGFPVLLLDEPFSSLDTESRVAARKVVRELAKELNLVTILVSHDPSDIEAVADETRLMEAGKMIVPVTQKK